MNQFAIGKIRVHRVEEWQGTFLPPAELFTGFDEVDWNRHEADFIPDHYDPIIGKSTAFVQSWVLDTGTQRILFDTGAGNDKDRPDLPIFDKLNTDFLDRLAAAGFQPEDIDTVVCSHIHVDHVGWNTRLVEGQWEPTFRNARYVFPLPDRDYWDPQIEREGPGQFGALVNGGMFEDSVRPILTAGRAEWIEDGFELAPNITLHARPGHTPGSMIMQVASEGATAMFVGDVVHHPAQIFRPDWNSAFCENGEQARESRRRVLEDAADREALLIPAHFAGAHVARVAREGTGFRPILPRSI